MASSDGTVLLVTTKHVTLCQRSKGEKTQSQASEWVRVIEIVCDWVGMSPFDLP